MHLVQRGYVISGSKEGSYPLHWLCLVFLRMRDRRIRNTGREINDVRPKFLIRWLRRLFFLAGIIHQRRSWGSTSVHKK